MQWFAACLLSHCQTNKHNPAFLWKEIDLFMQTDWSGILHILLQLFCIFLDRFITAMFLWSGSAVFTHCCSIYCGPDWPGCWVIKESGTAGNRRCGTLPEDMDLSSCCQYRRPLVLHDILWFDQSMCLCYTPNISPASFDNTFSAFLINTNALSGWYLFTDLFCFFTTAHL